MAAQQTRQRHPAARPKAETVDRLVGVFGAGRQMPTFKTDKPGQRITIEFDETAPKEARRVEAGFWDAEQATPPQPWSDPRSASLRFGQWRPPRHRTLASSTRGGPCSRAPAPAPRCRPNCLRAA